MRFDYLIGLGVQNLGFNDEFIINRRRSFVMINISGRKITFYLTGKMQRRLISLAQRNKLKNLRIGVKREEKLPETMGAIVREALEEYFQRKEPRKKLKEVVLK